MKFEGKKSLRFLHNSLYYFKNHETNFYLFIDILG